MRLRTRHLLFSTTHEERMTTVDGGSGGEPLLRLRVSFPIAIAIDLIERLINPE